jgi:hypothetical protein
VGEESETHSGKSDGEPAVVYRARIGDLFAGVSVVSLLAALGFFYSVFRNVGADARASIQAVETRLDARITKVEERLDRLIESGRR